MTEHITAWLVRIEGKLDALAPLPAQMEAIGKRLDEHIEKDEELFHGNGQPGLIKDVDRLKQERKYRNWFIAVILIPGLAAAADLVARLVSK